MKSQWFNGSNVGDLLAPLVLTGLTGETVVWSDQSPRWLVSGSILSMAQDHDTLFGAGSFERLDWMRAPQDLRILLVRGPRTAAHLGITCEIYGDCGLLMPLVYRPAQQEIQYELGIVPRYKSLEQTPVPPGARLISPGLPPPPVYRGPTDLSSGGLVVAPRDHPGGGLWGAGHADAVLRLAARL